MKKLLLFCLLLPLFQLSAAENIAVGRLQRLKLEIAGEALHPAPVDENSAVLIRLHTRTKTSDGYLYELDYTLLEAGEHDLSNYLLNKQQKKPSDLKPIKLTAISSLPKDFKGKLNSLEQKGADPKVSYQNLFQVLLPLWIIGLLFILLRFRKKKPLQLHSPQVEQLCPYTILLKEIKKARTDQQTLSFKKVEASFLNYAMESFEADNPHQLMKALHWDKVYGPLLRELEMQLHQANGGQNLDQLENYCREQLRKNDGL